MDFYCILLLSFTAFVFTAIAFPVALRMAQRWHIVDSPDSRKLQSESVPVFGGAAVAFGVFVPLISIAAFFHLPALWYELLVMALLLAIGITDDVWRLPAWFRFVVEFFLVWFLLWRTHILIDDFHGLWNILQLSVYSSLPLSVIAGVGIVNAVNLIDGVDGYSSGYGIVANTLFAVVFFLTGETIHGFFSLVAASALLPFFLHNVFGRHSKMFIGDGGSLLIGMIITCDVFALLSAQSLSGSMLQQKGIGVVALSLAILCIPVFDTLRVMFARMAKGISPFTPDKTHLHHLFIDMGFSHVGTSLTIILANLMIVILWWIAYRCGASVNMQFYIVILLGMLTTFGFYGLMRRSEKRQNALWHRMQRMGKWTHFEQKGAWIIVQRIIDKLG